MTRMTTILTAIGLLALPASLRAQDPALVGQGAGVWANNCVRCHNARPSTERTDAQWSVIVNHMRARANLTRAQAVTVTAFLQATNLPEGGPAAANAESPETGSADGPNVDGPGAGRVGIEEPTPSSDDGTADLDRRLLERLIAYLGRLHRP